MNIVVLFMEILLCNNVKTKKMYLGSMGAILIYFFLGFFPIFFWEFMEIYILNGPSTRAQQSFDFDSRKELSLELVPPFWVGLGA